MGIWFAVSATRKARRLAIMRQPFPPAWHELLLKGLPPYAHLPQPLQARLQAYTMLFLAEKHFEGCGGQEISDEVRVTISAQACLLLIGQQTKCYPKLRSVLVYPHTYIAGGKGSFGAQHEAPSARLGESWQTGVVVLSWNSVKGGATNFDDGQNVTLHEFAHQLDQEDGAADGTPILKDVSCYRPWSRALTKEYSNFLSRVKKHRKTVVDRYGATNPAEYFATATEAFFEKPDQLSEKQPDLFDALQQYYQLDPRNWS
jgi:Mlc titration factor MtfA (ptsG expression regulator)